MDLLNRLRQAFTQRIVKPIGSDFAKLGPGLANLVQNKIPGFTQQHIPGAQGLSEALYGKAAPINPTQGPGQVAMNWQGGAINKLNPSISSDVYQGARGLFDSNPLSFARDPIEKTLGINTRVQPTDRAGNIAYGGGLIAGSIPSFIGGDIAAGKALASVPKVADLTEGATNTAKIARLGTGALKAAIGGAVQSATRAPAKGTNYLTDIGKNALTSAPFGVSADIAPAAGGLKSTAQQLAKKGIQIGAQNLASAGISDALNKGKINVQQLLEIGVPAALLTIATRGKAADNPELDKFLTDNPEVADKANKLLALPAPTQDQAALQGSQEKIASADEQINKANQLSKAKLALPKGEKSAIPEKQSTVDALNKVRLSNKALPKGAPKTLGEALPAGESSIPPEGPTMSQNANTAPPGAEPFAPPTKNKFDNPYELNYKLGPDSPLTDTVTNNYRTRLAGRKGQIIEQGEQVAKQIHQIVPKAADDTAAFYARDLSTLKPGEVQQFLDGTHPEYENVRNQVLQKGGTPEQAQAAVDKGIALVNSQRQFIERALSGDPKIQQAADIAGKEFFDPSLEYGQKVRAIGPEVNTNNYSPHVIGTINGTPKDIGAAGEGLGSGFKYGQQRIRPTLLHNLANGEIPKVTKLSDAIRVYARPYARAVATRETDDALIKAGLAQYMTPEELDANKDQFVQLGNEHYDTNVTDEKGYQRSERQVLAVRKELGDNFNNTFGKGISGFLDAKNPISRTLKNVQSLQQFIRSQNFMGSLYHALHNLISPTVGAIRDPRAVFQYMDKIQDPEWRSYLARIGVTLDNNTDYRKALSASTGEGLPKQYENDLGGAISKIYDSSGPIKAVGEGANKVADAISNVTFEKFQEPAKIIAATREYNNFINSAAKAGKKLSQQEIDQHMINYSKNINASLGGLNYESLGFPKAMRQISRFLLLAPDFFISQLSKGKYALVGDSTTGATGQVANEARKQLITELGFIFSATAITSFAMTGKVSSNPFQVLLGHDANGREKTINLFGGGLWGDIANLQKDSSQQGIPGGAAEVLTSKLAPGLNQVSETARNQNYFGQQIVDPNASAADQLKQYVQYSIGQGGVAPVPFELQNIGAEVGADLNPNSTKKYSPGDIALTAVVGKQPSTNLTPAEQFIYSKSGSFPTNPATKDAKTQLQAKIKAGTATEADYTAALRNGTFATASSLQTFIKDQGQPSWLNSYNRLSAQDKIAAYQKMDDQQKAYIKSPPDGSQPVRSFTNTPDQNIFQRVLQGAAQPTTTSTTNAATNVTSNYYSDPTAQKFLDNSANLNETNLPLVVEQNSKTGQWQVNTTLTNDQLSQLSEEGKFGNWAPAMDNAIANTGANYPDVKLPAAAKDFMLKQIRYETGYVYSKDANNKINDIVNKDYQAFKQTGNWPDAFMQFYQQQGDPAPDETYQTIDNSASVSGVQNMYKILWQSNTSGTYIDTKPFTNATQSSQIGNGFNTLTGGTGQGVLKGKNIAVDSGNLGGGGGLPMAGLSDTLGNINASTAISSAKAKKLPALKVPKITGGTSSSSSKSSSGVKLKSSVKSSGSGSLKSGSTTLKIKEPNQKAYNIKVSKAQLTTTELKKALAGKGISLTHAKVYLNNKPLQLSNKTTGK